MSKTKTPLTPEELTALSLKRSKRNRVIMDHVIWMAMAAIPLAFLIIFKYWPMAGIVIAFKKFVPRKGIWGSPWNGLDNIEFFFKGQDWARTVGNTLFYGVSFLVVEVLVGVLMALMFYFLKSKKGLKIYQSTIMLPRFISVVLVTYMVYALLSPSYGVFNQIITALGGDPVKWYSDPKLWRPILIIVHIWQIAGSGSLYYFGSLMSMDGSLFEAAELDGASTWQKCIHVAVPHLIPTIATLSILGIGRVLSVDFGLFYNVPLDQGVLYSTTDVIGTYTYRVMLTGALERSAAVGLATSLVGLILVLSTNAIVRKISPENAMF